MNSEDPEDLEKSLACFKKCGNIDMCFSIAHSLGCDEDSIAELTQDLIEVLVSSSRFREAGILHCQLPKYDLARAVDLYSKGNAFMEGIRESMKEQDDSLRQRYLGVVKQSLTLAYDVKKNQFLKVLDDFDKRYLRLKIVQHSKKNMPQAFGGDN